MDNAPYLYGDVYTNATFDYKIQNSDVVQQLLNVEWIILGISAFVLIFVAVAFFRPAVNMVFKEFDLVRKNVMITISIIQATAALLSVSKTTIEANYAKLKEIMNIQDKKKKKAEGRHKFGLSALPEDGTESHDDDDDEDEDDDLANDDDGQTGTDDSRTKLFVVLTTQYTVAFLLIFSIFIGVILATYFNGLGLMQAGTRTDLGLKIRYILWRLGWGAQMLHVDDQFTYPDRDELVSLIKTDLDTYNAIQLALLFGSTKLGIDEGRLPEGLKDIMFNRIYLDKT